MSDFYNDLVRLAYEPEEVWIGKIKLALRPDSRVPSGEVHLVDDNGQIVAKIINLREEK